jgi:acyl-CoA hydrolase
MKQRTHIINHLVKSEDLNHHGTLFAGKAAMWFVESGFIAAAGLTNPENIVCVNIHGMVFKKPIHNGAIVRFESEIAFAGKTRLVSYIKVVDNRNEEVLLDGFITFVHVDEHGKRRPHVIAIEVSTPEDIELQDKARNL